MAIDPVSLAITAAVAAINMAVTASRTIEGPRLKDTSATLADYGTPLNYFIGERILACPCFFAKPIREKKKKRKGKSGKQVTYSGFGTWASHIADHGILSVEKIWFDGHLVLDDTGAETEIYPLSDDYELEANIRIYYGTETQEPDPDMLAFIEARDGPGTCPAYRPTAYVYFENIPLEMLGNRFPNVTMLVRYLAAPRDAEVDLDFENGAYSINGVSKTLEEVFEDAGFPDDPPFTAYGDPLDWVIPGEGFKHPVLDDPSTPGFPTEVIAKLTAEAMAALLEAGGPIVGTYVANFDLDGAGSVLNGEGGQNGAGCFVDIFADDDGTSMEITTNEPPGAPGSGVYVVVNGVQVDVDDFDFPEGEHEVDFEMGETSVSIDTPDAAASAAASGEGVANLYIWPGMSWASDPRPDAYPTATIRRITFTAEATVAPEDYIPTLADLVTFVAERSNVDLEDIDVSEATQPIPGYNWITGSGRQILEPMLDLLDVDPRPHNFQLQFLPRGGASQGVIATGEMVRDRDKGTPYQLRDVANSDLARRVFLIFADMSIDQNPNVAMPSGPDPDAAGSVREFPIDMSTFAAEPDYAQQLIERRVRRGRFGRNTADFSVTRQLLAAEPGDVWTPTFDTRTWTMRNTKLQIGANGVLAGEWERDAAALAVLSGSAGAIPQGQTPDTITDSVASLGFVIDGALMVDAHEQTAPFAYLVAGPEGPGIWPGADYAQSDTGELDSYTPNWDGIAAGDGAVIGECVNVMPDAIPWVPDMGTILQVTINAGELTAATLEELLEDETLNLVAIRSGTGWEYAQFMTPTLTGPQAYSIQGWLRGVRGTEWAMAGHQAGDAFVLMDVAKIHTMGASEIGDTDYYVVSGTGIEPDQDDAFSERFTGAAHKPYAAIYGEVELDESSPGSGDVLFDAIRRTRIGGWNLDGQDVPLGETAEAWSLDIMDNTVSPQVVKRTINASSLPIRYTEAMQIADWGAPLAATSPIVIPEANLYQVSPPLTLRGYPLNFPEGTI